MVYVQCMRLWNHVVNLYDQYHNLYLRGVPDMSGWLPLLDQSSRSPHPIQLIEIHNYANNMDVGGTEFEHLPLDISNEYKRYLSRWYYTRHTQHAPFLVCTTTDQSWSPNTIRGFVWKTWLVLCRPIGDGHVDVDVFNSEQVGDYLEFSDVRADRNSKAVTTMVLGFLADTPDRHRSAQDILETRV